MVRVNRIIFKSAGYIIVYIVLSVLMIALSILVSREVVLGISDCNGMGCLGEGFLIIIIGIVSGLITSTIMIFLVYLRLEIRYEIREKVSIVDDKQSETSICTK